MKTIFTLLLVCIAHLSFAFGYNVEKTSDIFNTITTSANDYKDKAVEIDFFFKAVDQYYNKIEKIDAYGRVYFLNEGDEKMNFISALGFTDAKHVESKTEKIQYSTSGSEGNRIFKIEWKDIQYKLKSGLVVAMNYQMWFYEMGQFEVHYGSNDANMVIETPTYIGYGKTDKKAKKLNYEATLDIGPFGASLNVDKDVMSPVKYVPGRDTKYIFNQDETYTINSLVSYNKNETTAFELYIEMENEHSLVISIDDQEGNTVYFEEVTDPSILIQRELDLNLEQSEKCYLAIETPEKVFITKILLQ